MVSLIYSWVVLPWWLYYGALTIEHWEVLWPILVSSAESPPFCSLSLWRFTCQQRLQHYTLEYSGFPLYSLYSLHIVLRVFVFKCDAENVLISMPAVGGTWKHLEDTWETASSSCKTTVVLAPTQARLLPSFRILNFSSYKCPAGVVVPFNLKIVLTAQVQCWVQLNHVGQRCTPVQEATH